MYSLGFQFQFSKDISQAERFTLLAEIFLQHQGKLAKPHVKANGLISFMSFDPKTSSEIKALLFQKENDDILDRIFPIWPERIRPKQETSRWWWHSW